MKEYGDSAARTEDLPSGVDGVADPHFACAVRAFAALFGSGRPGGGALAVYLDGQPVVDVWTGWSDRRGTRRWNADTGAVTFSATKGAASTVIHRLVDRGLLEYDVPVATYWKAFGANGKSAITLRDLMSHRAGLSDVGAASLADLLDHEEMEARLAAAPTNRMFGKPAYHAFTYGWLMSGVARAVTGRGMRELFRSELAGPLQTDGLHLGRPPADSPSQVAEIVIPQRLPSIPLIGSVASRLAALSPFAGLAAFYVPGITTLVQGDMPILDTEMGAANGVFTARGLARMYGAIANGGTVDGTQLLSPDLIAGLTGTISLTPDRAILVPMSFHLGYHAIPVPGLLPGFGHVGLGGTIGWADPASGFAFAFVHNRLLTPLFVSDHVTPVALQALLRRGVESARRDGVRPIPLLGAKPRQTAGFTNGAR